MFGTIRRSKSCSFIQHAIQNYLETLKVRSSKQNLFTQEKTEIFQPKMDVLIFRFPHLAGEIFDYLDDKNLAI